MPGSGWLWPDFPNPIFPRPSSGPAGFSIGRRPWDNDRFLAITSEFNMQQRPPIILSSLDAVRLERVLDALGNHPSPDVDELRSELDLANIVDPKDIPPDVVTMNSTVTFKVASSDKDFSLTLVYPADVGDGVDKISVLAPVGSALLGLREGDEIAWPKPRGGQLLVTIIKVTEQPERSGDFLR